MSPSTDTGATVPGPVLDAMREWCSHRTGATVAHLWRDHVSEVTVLKTINDCYEGGVEAFLRDHGNEGGAG